MSKTPLFKQLLAPACLALAGLLAWPVMAEVAALSLTQGQRQALAHGEVLVLEASEQEAAAHLVAVVQIEASLAQIFDAITSCRRAAERHQPLKECELITMDGEHQLVRHVVDASWLTPRQEYLMRVDFPSPREFVFRQVEGDFRVFEGSWQLTESATSGQWLARYELTIRPGFPAPRWVQRIMLEKNVPRFMDVVRRLAEQAVEEEAQATIN